MWVAGGQRLLDLEFPGQFAGQAAAGTILSAHVAPPTPVLADG